MQCPIFRKYHYKTHHFYEVEKDHASLRSSVSTNRSLQLSYVVQQARSSAFHNTYDTIQGRPSNPLARYCILSGASATSNRTMCFGYSKKSHAARFQEQQYKQIEKYEKRQKEMEKELKKQKKAAKRHRSHYGFRFGNVGHVHYSPGASL